ncbi:thioredoxin reductase [Arcticibacter tournemirensis]|uniref:NAD(P)/FAD-dependent oxidoreductase n=1 Tax=Arcticibacter tournemirensis TaxID=699437 RepID=A0A5M9GN80_9SPHI|nr:NAD(P)/FAD-dependent oxidoreductase [Arcticibacter tournemirensis]KAA8476036.1 NAD(P)/FAD-dependent oxidoreductase [Arcticibacter tournemirensis]TQM50082.1 thioredoxin reductase [Arcticibacter tournemirensis]
MENSSNFDVIIIGGSYSGLSAAMALGRSLRRVLIIDSGLPCNRQTPHSHNFITQDGKTPKEISQLAREQVEKYDTVRFQNGLAVKGAKTEYGFEVETRSGEKFNAKKIILATGVRDIMPAITGFSECWGISVVHCPYCHGYEIKSLTTGILADGDAAMHYALLVGNLTKDLVVFTNGASSLRSDQRQKLEDHNIAIVEAEVDRLEQSDGQIERIVFKNGTTAPVKALYARVPFVQHSDIPEQLGCEMTEEGLVKTTAFQQTTVSGVFACGDSATLMRSVANAVASGNLAGAAVNKELCEEAF